MENEHTVPCIRSTTTMLEAMWGISERKEGNRLRTDLGEFDLINRLCLHKLISSMHELSIAENICDVVKSHLHTGQRLKSIHLCCGIFSGVVKSSLDFCFDLTASRLGLNGAALVVETPTAQGICSECGEITEVKEMWTPCKKCGYIPLSVEGGKELRITKIEVEEVENV